MGASAGLGARTDAAAAAPRGGENFSANKPPAALFASDCTGAGCHKGPQGLGKEAGIGRPRGLPARALHQQPRKRRRARQLPVGCRAAPDPRDGSPPPRRPRRLPRQAVEWIEGLRPRDVKPAARRRASAGRPKPAEPHSPARRRAPKSGNRPDAAPAAGAAPAEPPPPRTPRRSQPGCEPAARPSWPSACRRRDRRAPPPPPAEHAGSGAACAAAARAAGAKQFDIFD